MPARDTQELRGRSDVQLRADLEEAHQGMFNLRFQAATRQLADVSQINVARKRIARIKTLLREREILAEADAASSELTQATAVAQPAASAAPEAIEPLEGGAGADSSGEAAGAAAGAGERE